MNAPRDKSYEAQLTQALTDPLEAAAYLDAAMEMEDPAAVLLALRQVGQVGQSHGMALLGAAKK